MRKILLIILHLFVAYSAAAKTCYQCEGINCQRTTYNATQECVDELDICATVYEGETLQAQGCLQQMPIELRRKCDEREIHDDNVEEQERMPSQCHKCQGSYCNNVVSDGFECLQCDSSKDIKCRTSPGALTPLKCPISRSNNVFCYVKDDGKRTLRGCLSTTKDQTDCRDQTDCMLCSSFDLQNCNVVQIREHDDDGSSGGNNGDGNGNDGGNNGSGNGNDGGNSGSGNGNDGGNNGGSNGNGGNGNGNGNGGTSGDDDKPAGSANTIKLNIFAIFSVIFAISLLIL